jgi:hypothetical protein
MSRPAYLVSAIARQRLDEIYSYTRERGVVNKPRSTSVTCSPILGRSPHAMSCGARPRRIRR